MPDAAVDIFITKMAAVFGKPDTADSASFKEVLRDRLSEFDAGVLTGAANHFIETRKSWPRVADMIAVAQGQHAQQNPRGARPSPWVKAEDMTGRWFEARTDGTLIDRAEAEGWTDALWQDVKCTAHAKVVASFEGGRPQELADITPAYTSWHLEYNRDRARTYREAAEYQKTPAYRKKYGPGSVDKKSNWLKAGEVSISRSQGSGEQLRQARIEAGMIPPEKELVE